jgi:hypothetical protein
LRQIVYAGAQNTSFAAGRDDLLKLARLKISEKQVERVTERIGHERLDQRDAEVQAFLELPVMAKFAAAVAHPPDLAVVEMDGGRLQIRKEPRSAPAVAGVASPVQEVDQAVEATPGQAVTKPAAPGTHNHHWREDKIGLLMTMNSKESAADPCPEIPETFVNPLRIIKLARELHKGCAPSEDAVADPPGPEGDDPLVCSEYTPPTVRVKSMVATRQDADSLGKSLAAAARARGFYGAGRRAFVADGAECNWTVQKRWFSDFVPIVDFIHVLSYVFAAAMAGRSFGQGWPVYVQWIGLVWKGRVAEVITGLGRRQEELGLPTKDESETSPRRVVADTLRYLKNNQSRMKYDEYRRLGLPITSSHVESTVKQFNRRVKGTEKFWSEEGAEAMLQLRADYLSETAPIEKFWKGREAAATGRRRYRRAV